MLISAAAVAATLGGWVAMAATDVPASSQAETPVISSVNTSAQGVLDILVMGDAPAGRPLAPLAITRSSR
jgi:hypothetical protein